MTKAKLNLKICPSKKKKTGNIFDGLFEKEAKKRRLEICQHYDRCVGPIEMEEAGNPASMCCPCSWHDYDYKDLPDDMLTKGSLAARKAHQTIRSKKRGKKLKKALGNKWWKKVKH